MTGIATATGDNGSGSAGMMWRTNLYRYSIFSAQNRPLPLAFANYILIREIISDSLDVLFGASDQAMLRAWSPDQREAEADELADEFRRVLMAAPDLIIAMPTGNDGFSGSVTDYVRDFPKAGILRAGLLKVREDPQYANNVIFVAGADTTGLPWVENDSVGSNLYSDVTDIAAPAWRITGLARWDGQTGSQVPLGFDSGTSMAVPFVAGAAAQIWTLDPTLTAAQIKDYLIRGASNPRLNANADSIVPSPVTGQPTC